MKQIVDKMIKTINVMMEEYPKEYEKIKPRMQELYKDIDHLLWFDAVYLCLLFDLKNAMDEKSFNELTSKYGFEIKWDEFDKEYAYVQKVIQNAAKDKMSEMQEESVSDNGDGN